MVVCREVGITKMKVPTHPARSKNSEQAMSVFSLTFILPRQGNKKSVGNICQYNMRVWNFGKICSILLGEGEGEESPSISPQPPTRRLPSLEIHEYIRKSLLMRLLTRLVLKKQKTKRKQRTQVPNLALFFTETKMKWGHFRCVNESVSGDARGLVRRPSVSKENEVCLVIADDIIDTDHIDII